MIIRTNYTCWSSSLSGLSLRISRSARCLPALVNTRSRASSWLRSSRASSWLRSSRAGSWLWSSRASSWLWSSRASSWLRSSRASSWLWSSRASSWLWSSRAGSWLWSSRASSWLRSSRTSSCLWSSRASSWLWVKRFILASTAMASFTSLRYFTVIPSRGASGRRRRCRWRCRWWYTLTKVVCFRQRVIECKYSCGFIWPVFPFNTIYCRT
jgi:hypothetical protein